MQTLTNKSLVIRPQCRIEIKTKQKITFQCRICRNYFYVEECLLEKKPRHIMIMKAHYKPIHIERPKPKVERVLISRKYPPKTQQLRDNYSLLI